MKVFAKAMAETGQIKLYGDHPTLTETTLARARRHIFKKERYCNQQMAKVYHIQAVASAFSACDP